MLPEIFVQCGVFGNKSDGTIKLIITKENDMIYRYGTGNLNIAKDCNLSLIAFAR